MQEKLYFHRLVVQVAGAPHQDDRKTTPQAMEIAWQALCRFYGEAVLPPIPLLEEMRFNFNKKNRYLWRRPGIFVWPPHPDEGIIFEVEHRCHQDVVFLVGDQEYCWLEVFFRHPSSSPAESDKDDQAIGEELFRPMLAALDLQLLPYLTLDLTYSDMQGLHQVTESRLPDVVRMFNVQPEEQS